MNDYTTLALVVAAVIIGPSLLIWFLSWRQQTLDLREFCAYCYEQVSTKNADPYKTRCGQELL